MYYLHKYIINNLIRKWMVDVKMVLFEINNVSYYYSRQIEALKDVSFSIEQSEQIAILGANGCGKSTLLKLLAGLIFPSKGLIKAFGEELTESKFNGAKNAAFVRNFRKRIGVVFQNSDTQLFCPTVFDEIAFGPLQLELPNEEITQRVQDVMEMLEITHLKNRSPYALSGGEKKRVAIASVLPVNPDILLLDEPTIALDPRTQSWLEDFLHTLGKAGKTIIIATHNLDIVDAISDRTIVFGEDHRLVADSRSQEILDNHELLLNVNLVHEHFHKHGKDWHKHDEKWMKHSHNHHEHTH